MNIFLALLKINMKRRLTDGFAIGYNVIFPFIMIGVLGTLTKNMSHGAISGYFYYTVVVIPFCIAMSIVTAAYSAKEDAYANTAQRILTTPVRKWHLVCTKIISCGLIVFLCSELVYIIMAIICKTGRNGIGIISLIFFLFSFAISALGSWIGFGMKNFMVVKNIMTVPISALALAGGVFFPFGTFHPLGRILINLSPFTWINRSLFSLLFDSQKELIITIAVLLIISIIIISTIAVRTFKKGAYCEGSLSDIYA